MKVDLRIHEKARQHESFGRLDSSFFNPKRCLLRSGILSGRCDRQDAKRIYETIVIALCGGLLGRNTRGGAIVAGALNLGGSIEMIPNAIRIAELAIDKQAQTLLLPVSSRRQLNELPDELWTKISIEFYKDGADAVFKALVE
jgi:predicted ATP-dependent Lon-type protease